MRQISLSVSIWLGSLSVLCASAGCADNASEQVSRTGRLEVALTASSSSGAQYRLRNGTFKITGASTKTLSSDAQPDAPTLTTELATGGYSIELATGWSLQKRTASGSFESVKAALGSANPVAFTIVDQQSTSVLYRFKVGDDVVQFGNGRLVIGIDVDDQPGDAGSGDSGDAGGGVGEWKEVATLSASNGVAVEAFEGIQVIDSDRKTVLVATRNVGAQCGGGTPAAVWRITIDPATGTAAAQLQQSLSLIENVRLALFEQSNGTLFTGSGWCGPKPPYYSIDHGLTFTPATVGVYPPSSTFSYVEFQGQVYAGTGYEPYDGEVYRWLGGGSWTRVLDIPPPRSIVESMAAFEDHLFVASDIYGWGGQGCESSVPVYISTDGVQFSPTTGIARCMSVPLLATAGGQLFAIANVYDAAPPITYANYRWDPVTATWKALGSLPFDRLVMANSTSSLFAYGVKTGTSVPGIYRSADGVTWTKVIDVQSPAIGRLHFEFGTLYAGSEGTGGVAKLFSIKLEN